MGHEEVCRPRGTNWMLRVTGYRVSDDNDDDDDDDMMIITIIVMLAFVLIKDQLLPYNDDVIAYYQYGI